MVHPCSNILLMRSKTAAVYSASTISTLGRLEKSTAAARSSCYTVAAGNKKTLAKQYPWLFLFSLQTKAAAAAGCNFRAFSSSSTALNHGRFLPYLLTPTSPAPPEKEEENIDQTKRWLKYKCSLNPRMRRDWLQLAESYPIGSSHGWVGYMGREGSCFLRNPLLLNDAAVLPYIPLPSIDSSPFFKSVKKTRCPETGDMISDFSEGYIIHKFALSSAPKPICATNRSTAAAAEELTDDTTIMMAIVKAHSSSNTYDCDFDQGFYLVFCRVGRDSDWTLLKTEGSLYDITYSSKTKRFYGLSRDGDLISWDLWDPDSPKEYLLKRGMPNDKCGWCDAVYLVECSGDLFCVHKLDGSNGDGDDGKMCGFEVYKLDVEADEWVYSDDIGDRAMFLGRNHSISLSTREFSGLRPNSIYYNPCEHNYDEDEDDEEEAQKEVSSNLHDIYLHNIGDHTTTHIHHVDCIGPCEPKNCPIWVAPHHS